ncbi:lipoyl(octanoyl) transferase LipB [Sphingomonas sp. BGYR3]|uniref:lipoyl(octanoyl) transferase LipB n=1 Tax=Sphingomonas sp. BGYR3 TaxID=2975483 RepID=UPI0021A86BA5|nr:lipoyl(octanoyl) transferase LipB [Sphingomonas sp. BGYR3]MDG5488229.1 lipoyl(octanoyl) transferase LipB [Sphingomonas sp. BGYR3]
MLAADHPVATPLAPRDGVEWRVSAGLTDYDAALQAMTERAAMVGAGTADELVWLLEHPPLYTAGTSADPAELIDRRFPVHTAGRGGRYTYHGPGQRVGYLMLDLTRRGRDVRCFVHQLEAWLIATLGDLGIHAYAVDGRVGIWTADGGTEAKIGAIGVRVRRWVTMHGFSINLSPDLSHFGGIVPCGLPEFPVTSAAALGRPVTPAAFDAALHARFPEFCDRLAASGRCGVERADDAL